GFTRRCLHDRANANLVAVPTLDRDAAVLAGIHIQRPRGHRRLAHFAEALVVAIAEVVVAARIGVGADLRAGVVGVAAVTVVVAVAGVPRARAANLAADLCVDARARSLFYAN